MVKMKKKMGKVFWLSILFQSYLQPVTALISIGGRPQITAFTINHQPQSTIFMRTSKGLQERPCFISASGGGCH